MLISTRWQSLLLSEDIYKLNKMLYVEHLIYHSKCPIDFSHGYYYYYEAEWSSLSFLLTKTTVKWESKKRCLFFWERGSEEGLGPLSPQDY